MHDSGLVALMQGKYELARCRFGEEMTLSKHMEDQANIAYCVKGLAAVAGMQGKVERSTQLFGAVEGLLETHGVPVWTFYHPERSLYKRTVSDLRVSLGEAAWAATFAEGSAMWAEEAVEYALSADERSPTALPKSEQHSTGTEQPDLTRREKEVAALVARDLTNRQIAKELVGSERTVENHVANILKKLGLHSRVQVTATMSDRQLHQPNLR